eukprot:Gb_38710 [translate_table: standard]
MASQLRRRSCTTGQEEARAELKDSSSYRGKHNLYCLAKEISDIASIRLCTLEDAMLEGKDVLTSLREVVQDETKTVNGHMRMDMDREACSPTTEHRTIVESRGERSCVESSGQVGKGHVPSIAQGEGVDHTHCGINTARSLAGQTGGGGGAWDDVPNRMIVVRWRWTARDMIDSRCQNRISTQIMIWQGEGCRSDHAALNVSYRKLALDSSTDCFSIGTNFERGKFISHSATSNASLSLSLVRLEGFIVLYENIKVFLQLLGSAPCFPILKPNSNLPWLQTYSKFTPSNNIMDYTISTVPPHAFVQFAIPTTMKEACRLAQHSEQRFNGHPLKVKVGVESSSCIYRRKDIPPLRFSPASVEIGSLISPFEFCVGWRAPTSGVEFHVDPFDKRCTILFNWDTLFHLHEVQKDIVIKCDFKIKFLVRDIRSVEFSNERGTLVMLLQLWVPPWIYYRAADDDIYTGVPFTLLDDKDPWI